MNETPRTTEFAPQETAEPSAVLPLRFFADLTREEYIDFMQMRVQLATGGRVRAPQLLSTFCSAVVLLGTAVAEYVAGGRLDLLTAGLGLLILLMGIRTALQPRHVARVAARGYDATIAAGRTFRGVVSITSEQLEKSSNGETLVVRFDAPNALYMETADMIAVSGADSNMIIVLPARVMTPAATEALHNAALACIPSERCRIRQLLQPQATELIPADGAEAQAAACAEDGDADTIDMTVRYTPEEFFAMLRDGAYRGFLNYLPQILGLALIVALLWGWMYGAPGGVIVFIVMAIALFLANTAGVTLRARRRVRDMSDGDLTVRLRFNWMGITGDRGLFLAWHAVRHAVDRPDCLEFYNKRLFIRIPKRCVEDMEAVRALVDRYMRGSRQAP